MFLIVGANSEIGSATARLIRSRGGETITTTRRPPIAPGEMRLDLVEPIGGQSIPDGVESACIFAAIARLAACEADAEGSAFINVTQTLALVDRLSADGIYTLFLSTNQVFDGARAHVPADAIASPVSEYGRQKAAAEKALLARMARGAPIGILRLAKVVSPGMPLLSTWREGLAAGGTVRAFTDMRLAPVPVGIAAEAILRLLQERQPVIAQLSGPRDISYAEVACALAREIRADPRLVEPVSARDQGMPSGSTPHHTTLDSSYIASAYGLTVPDAAEVISALL